MATIQAFIRVSKKKTGKVNIRFRLRDGRKVDLSYTSDIQINPDLFDSKKQKVKERVLFNDKDEFNKSIVDLKTLLESIYNSEPNKGCINSEWLETKINEKLHPENIKQHEEKVKTFFDEFHEFLMKHKLSKPRINNYNVVIRALQRFELYTAQKTKKPFKMTFDSITSDMLSEIDTFLKGEYLICDTMPELYDAIPETRKPKPRGQNTIIDIFKKLRTFYIWSIENGTTNNNPFKKFKIEECIYGTPIYISNEERKKLYKTDLSNRPALAIQRDIFVFQCLIGCRIGDLNRLTRANIIGNNIEYIPRKTIDGRPITLSVPIHETAAEIIKRYENIEEERLLPFILDQKYNKSIKEAFKIAELTRMTTTLNPTTRQEEKRPLNEIATSHTARKSFIANLYKQVKDPNLIAALSGHKEGSKAFARYREIDEDIKKDLIKLLD
jgi:integrase